eukprot:scaffold24227_cov30-Tisochrysis_lutea.AAC.3
MEKERASPTARQVPAARTSMKSFTTLHVSPCTVWFQCEQEEGALGHLEVRRLNATRDLREQGLHHVDKLGNGDHLENLLDLV